MKVIKANKPVSGGTVSAGDMALINGFAKKTITNDKVFTFEILLCDNDVDRDHERFDTKALPRLAELFVGKTGIFDHEWSAKGQTARIYKTEVVTDPVRCTAAGEPYAYLKAWAYMLRDGHEDVVAAIEGGILREVSVGCGMGGAVCSICGEAIGSSKCGHERGGEYGGAVCHAILTDPQDAYEWSFVAVPAQKNAGVIKKFTPDGAADGVTEKSAAVKNADECEKMAHLAALGERYLENLRRDVVRLGIMADSGFEGDFLERMAKKLDEDELECFKKAFTAQAEAKFPVACQLKSYSGDILPESGEFLI